MAKIAIVLNTSWNIFNFRLPLLKHLSDAGHEIIAIAPEDSYSNKIPYEFHPIPIKSRSLNPFNHLAVVWDLFKIFRRVQPEIALLYTIHPNTHGNFAARLAGVRTISNIAGLGNVFIDKRFATRVAKLLYKVALSHPDIVFFQNHTDKDMFLKLGLVSKDKAQRIPGSGVDIKRFAPGEKREPTNDKPFVFLLATRLLWEKGVREFAEAGNAIRQKHESVIFRIIGPLGIDNPTALTSDDMQWLTESGAIEYAGISDQMEDVIQDADCVVLPSYREGLPKILLEAAAMAKPIITTQVPGCMDVVEHGLNGLLCEARNAGDLKVQMLRMLNLDDESREQMGAKGREKVTQGYAQEVVFSHYEKAVNLILNKQTKISGANSFWVN